MIITSAADQFHRLRNIINKRQKQFPFSYVVIFYALHIALAFGMQYVEGISTVHAMIAVFIAVVFSFVNSRRITTLYGIAYLSGAEALWRMSHANVFWEFSKYAIILICIRGALEQCFKKFPIIIIYCLLLLPSINITILNNESFDEIRQLIAFNLSGPVALTICVLYLYRSKLYSAEFHNVFLMFIAPVLTMSVLVFIRYAGTDEFVFTLRSSFKTSGGFGPNQVSSLLGLGAFLAFCHVVEGKKSIMQKIMFYLIAIGFFTQAAFTFSRGGVTCAIGAAIIFIVSLVSNKKTMGMMVVTLGLTYGGLQFVALPALNNLTDGMLMQRFTQKTLTGRDTLLKSDIDLWKKHPILGVGPGMSKKTRVQDKFDRDVAAHTEFSRLIAEHGVFGIFALLVLFLFCFGVIKTSNTSTMRAFCFSFMAWGFLFMFINAMRLVAPCFMIGLATTMMATDKKVLYVKKLKGEKNKDQQKPKGKKDT